MFLYEVHFPKFEPAEVLLHELTVTKANKVEMHNFGSHVTSTGLHAEAGEEVDLSVHRTDKDGQRALLNSVAYKFTAGQDLPSADDDDALRVTLVREILPAPEPVPAPEPPLEG